MKVSNYTEVQAALRSMKPFDHSTCFANTYESAESFYTGSLSKANRDLMIEDSQSKKEGTLFYVVFSYSTPIAWAWTRADGTEMRRIPEAKYSTTTSKQQTYVRSSLPGEDA